MEVSWCGKECEGVEGYARAANDGVKTSESQARRQTGDRRFKRVQATSRDKLAARAVSMQAGAKRGRECVRKVNGWFAGARDA